MSERVLIVARVSTKGQGQSTGQQVEALQAQAARRGWPVVEVLEFEESAWSSSNVEAAVLERVKAGDVDVVMVWALDRLIRGGPLQVLQFVQSLEGHYKVGLYSLQEPFLSTAADSATRGLLLPLMAWVAEQESKRKSERLKAKADHKRQSAEKLGQRAKWGRGSMASDEDRRRVLALAAGGSSQRSIAAAVGISLGAVNKIVRGAA